MEENRTIKDYSTDELKKLYKSYSLYVVTKTFKHVRTYKTDKHLTMINDTEDGYKEWVVKCVLNRIRINNITDELNEHKYKDENEKRRLEYERTTLNICNDVLFWCNGGFTDTVERFKSGKQVQNPYELYDELHMNDDYDIKNGLPTKFDIYLFIWETLRFCTVDELATLLKYADSDFKTSSVGRPKIKAKIYKYDKDNKVVGIYEDRQSCMDANRIPKSTLSKILSGKREGYKGYRYEVID